MSQIRPVSNLRNSFADISRIVHENKEPVILTKNGYDDMVEEYERIQYESDVVRELRAAELEAETTAVRYDHEAILSDLVSMKR